MGFVSSSNNNFYYHNDFNDYNNGSSVTEFYNYNRTGNNNYISFNNSIINFNVSYINNSNFYIKPLPSGSNNLFYTQYLQYDTGVLLNFKNYTIITKIKKVADYGDSTFGLYFYSQINNTINGDSDSENGYIYLYSKDSDSVNSSFRFKGNEESTYLVNNVSRDINTPVIVNEWYNLNFTILNLNNGSVLLKAKIWNSTQTQPNDYEISNYIFNAGMGLLYNGSFGFIVKDCNMIIDSVKFYSNDFNFSKELFLYENITGYWHLDNNNTLDSSGNNHHAYIVGNTNFNLTDYVDGDSSLTFKRNNDGLNLTQIFPVTSYTSWSYSIWVKFNILSTYNDYLLSKRNLGITRHEVLLYKAINDTIIYRMTSGNVGNTYCYGNLNVINDTDKFYNVIITYNSSSKLMKLYIDNVLQDNTIFPYDTTSNTYKFWIGYNPEYSVNVQLDGTIDEIMMFEDYVLTTDNVEYIYGLYENVTEKDNISPDIDIFIYPQNNSILYDFNGSILFNITESGNCSIIFSNDSVVYSLFSSTANNTMFHFKNLSAVNYGDKLINISCRDMAYNWNNDSIRLYFSYLYNDTILPHFNIHYPLNNSYLNNLSWVNLSIVLFNLTDNIEVDECIINNSKFIKHNNTYFTFNKSGYYYNNIKFNLSISCNDTSNNIYNINNYVFTIDSQIPIITSYTNNTINHENISFTISINESSLVYWQYSSIDCNSFTHSGNTAPNGYYYPSYTLNTINHDELTTYYFNLTVVDRANNSNNDNYCYVVTSTESPAGATTQVTVNIDLNEGLLLLAVLGIYFAFLYLSFSLRNPMMLIFSCILGIFLSIWLWFDISNTINFPKILIALFLMFNAYMIFGFKDN